MGPDFHRDDGSSCDTIKIPTVIPAQAGIQ